eukprot:7347263-Alexandrium_andersonii.AAC.1
MSASLVGSEMCIRDRLEASVIRELSVPSGIKHARSPARLVHNGPVQPGAVSYTHLTLPTICSV